MIERAVIPILSRATGEVEFEVIVYGRRPEELATIPNEVIRSLARRFPEHTSSMFLLENPQFEGGVR